jgi:hypothetical protein
MLCSASPSRPLDYMRYLDVSGRGIQSWTTGWGTFTADRWKHSGIAPIAFSPTRVGLVRDRNSFENIFYIPEKFVIVYSLRFKA